MKFRITLLFLLSFFASVVSVEAQNDTVQPKLIEEVVITANYKPTGIDKSINPVRILNMDKLQTIGVQNVADALKFQGSINVVQDNLIGTQTSVQGLSGNNLKILIDGRPIIGRLNGNIDLSQLSTLNIDRLEIVEGPLSAQYGTDALGGIINIITKKNTDHNFDALISGYAESAGQLNLGAVVNYRLDEHNQIAINGGRNFFGGWSSVDTSRYQDWKPKIQYNAGARYTFTENRFTLSADGNYFNEYLLNRGKPIAPYGEYAFDDHYTTVRWNTGINAAYSINKQSKIDIQSGYSYYVRTKNSYYRDLVKASELLVQTPGSQDTSRFDQKMLRAVYSNIVSPVISFETGVDLNQQTGTGLRIRTVNNLIGDYAVFGSAEWTLFGGEQKNEIPPYTHRSSFSIKPALRAALNNTYKIPLIPSVNLKYNFASDWTLRGSWSRGFRAPDLKELYFYFVDINHNIIGNANLNPEESQNFLASLHFKKALTQTVYKAELGGFYNDVKNLITLAAIDLNSNAYTYINVGRYKTAGARLTGEITVKQLTLSGGLFLTNRIYYFNDTPVNGTSVDANAQIFYTVKPADITFNFWFKHTDRINSFVQDKTGKILNTFIDAYNLADIGASKKFLKNKLTATLGVKNILNVRTVASQLAAGALGVHSASDGGTNIAYGRNIFVKFDIHL